MRTFHRIRFGWPNDTKLVIESVGGREGNSEEPPVAPFLEDCYQELGPDKISQLGIPAVCWRDSEDSLFEPVQLRENTEYLIDITLPIDIGDASRAWQDDRSWPLTTIRNAYASDPPRRWRTSNGFVTITGRLNFRSYVGAAELCVPNVEPLLIEVACTKIGYFDDFRQLLDAIAEEYAMLLLEIEAPTFTRFSLADASLPQAMTFLFLLRHAMDEIRLPSAAESILASPRSQLVHFERLVPAGLQRDITRPDFVNRIPEGFLTSGGPLGDAFLGHTPALLPETIKTETTDTPENRYVKAFLEDLRDAADELHRGLVDNEKQMVARQVELWSGRISEWLEHPMWKDVRRMTHFPSNSQILQKAPAYREVLGTDLRMQLGMALPWFTDSQLDADVRGDLRPISQLYEYWCFFFLRSILQRICGQEVNSASTLVRETQGGLSVVLRRGTESRVQFRYEHEDGKTALVSLFYNRKFDRIPPGSEVWSGSYSAALNPDFSILIDVVTDPERMHWLHFDAKYRLDVSQWHEVLNMTLESLPRLEAELTNEEDGRIHGTYHRSDLFKMHTYRDALLGSRGSYVLFPGAATDEELFIRYPGVEHSEESQQIPSVGAFQASPAHQGEQSHRVEQFITKCIRYLLSAVGYQEETGLVFDDEY